MKNKNKIPEFKLDIDTKKVKRTAIKAGVLAGLAVSAVISSSLYFNAYKWSYQSPVLIEVQSPLIIEKRSAELISPLSVDQVQAQEATPSATPTPEATPSATLTGEASYYSREGCLGCHPQMIMANGQELDDSKHTVALVPELYKKYKNKIVLIENIATGDKVAAQVTDSGGFGKYGRVADLSLATKQGLNCGDLCQVQISLEVTQ